MLSVVVVDTKTGGKQCHALLAKHLLEISNGVYAGGLSRRTFEQLVQKLKDINIKGVAIRGNRNKLLEMEIVILNNETQWEEVDGLMLPAKYKTKTEQ